MIILAQDGNIGINTEPKNATLEIKIADINANNDTNQGILIPKISKKRLAKIKNDNLVGGTLVYVDVIDVPEQPNSKVNDIQEKGFYSYDDIKEKWINLVRPASHLDYIVSGDGRVLLYWFNKREHTIDMNNYPDMSGVTSIEQYLLQNADIQTFVVREGVTSIEKFAFENTRQANTITLPQSITNIGIYAFARSTGFKGQDLYLPNLTNLGWNAFEQADIKSIHFPLLTTIESEAFKKSTITSINLPQATVIGENAFGECNNLTSIYLPEAINIGNNAFGSSQYITQLNLPKATNIGGNSFAYLFNLLEMNLPVATIIGNRAFHGCINLENISLPMAKEIGEESFAGISFIIEVNLPSVEVIKEKAFQGAKHIHNMIIGPNIREIGALAFSDVITSSGSTFTIQATTPPDIQSNSFSSQLKFKVPAASVDAYKTKWAGIIDASRITGY